MTQNKPPLHLLADVDEGDIGEHNILARPLRQIRDWIETLTISADAKALLMSIATTTTRIGQTIVALGRRLLTTVMDLVKRFPMTAFGVIVGAVLSALITSIPLVGWLIGPFLSPLLMAFGLTLGAVADLRDHALEGRIRATVAEYEAFRGRTI